MECVECETSVQHPVVVTFITGRVEVLPLCADCTEEYREGAFVDSVSDDMTVSGEEL